LIYLIVSQKNKIEILVNIENIWPISIIIQNPHFKIGKKPDFLKKFGLIFGVFLEFLRDLFKGVFLEFSGSIDFFTVFWNQFYCVKIFTLIYTIPYFSAIFLKIVEAKEKLNFMLNPKCLAKNSYKINILFFKERHPK